MNLISYVDNEIKIVGTIEFDSDPAQLTTQLQALRKDTFQPNERIVIIQRTIDHYPFIDSYGTKLIELQKIVNQVDIANCFILILTHNPKIQTEIAEVNKVYSSDTTLFTSCVYPGDYKVPVRSYKNTACKKLWNHLYVGTDTNVLPCCVADHRYPLGNIANQSIKSILDSKESTQLRQWMINGYRIKACSICYQKEDNNITSHRQSFEPKTTAREKITWLDIRLNNICNFKCRMCSEYFSSSIQQETIDMFGKDAILGQEQIDLSSDSRKTRLNNLEKLLPYISEDIKQIYFAGGEPLIIEEHYIILDQLIAVKNFDIKMSYNSNLSKLTYKNKNIFDYWKQFSNVTVGASIDASGPTAEYVRHGTVWKNILDNIKQVKKETPHVHINITSTVSWMTIENLMELQALWIKQGLFTRDNFKITTLVAPKFLCLTSLPQFHKERLSEKIEQHIQELGQCELAQHWAEAKNFMNSTDSQYTLSEFTSTTQKLDNHRNESFVKVFPQFRDIYSVANNQQV
jgi:radical SAM protein with 4Fe4S-binding SPASM domain